MITTLMLMAGLFAAAPFPVDPHGNAALLRLRDAWSSPALDAEHRAEMDARIRTAAAGSRVPDWTAVADAFFAWRNADAAARDLRNAAISASVARAQMEVAARPAVCETETRSEPGLFGVTRSESKTTCRR